MAEVSESWGALDEDDGDAPFDVEVHLHGAAVIQVRISHAIAVRTAKQSGFSTGDSAPNRAELANWIGIRWAGVMEPSDHSLSILDASGVWWAVRRELITHVRVVDTDPDGSRPRVGFAPPQLRSSWPE